MTTKLQARNTPRLDDDDDDSDADDRSFPGLGARKNGTPSFMSSDANLKTASDGNDNDGDEEDDYMNMVIAEPTQKETSLQRRERLKREALIRGHPKSKAELAEEERKKREEGLNKSLLENESSKGLKMMKAMGFKTGEGLGKQSEPFVSEASAPTSADATIITPEKQPFEPIRPIMKESRAGIGHESLHKRKMLQDLDNEETPLQKRQAMSPEDYRERVRQESLAKRHEAQFHAAQKICDRFYTGVVDDEENGEKSSTTKNKSITSEPTFAQIHATPILWRGLLHHRAMKALQARVRHDLMQSGPLLGNKHLPGFSDPDMDKDDKMAMGTEEVALDEEWEDAELDAFEQRDVKERLDGIVKYLRETWLYCFWCKHRYADKEELKEACPGLTEDDHD